MICGLRKATWRFGGVAFLKNIELLINVFIAETSEQNPLICCFQLVVSYIPAFTLYTVQSQDCPGTAYVTTLLNKIS